MDDDVIGPVVEELLAEVHVGVDAPQIREQGVHEQLAGFPTICRI